MFEWVEEWIGEAIASAGGCVGEAAAASAYVADVGALLQSPLPMSLKSQNKQSHLSSSCSLS